MRRFFFCSFRPFPTYCAFLVVVVVGVYLVTPSRPHRPQDQRTVAESVENIPQVAARPRVLGYSRDRFGDGWGLQVTDLGICTTRHLLLVQAFGSPSGGCSSNGRGDKAHEAPHTVRDPYTHQPMDPQGVDIDHIVPLAAAWDLGAYQWPEARRRQFANDTARNLLVTASAVNREKSDSTLSQWLPPVEQCGYSARFVAVASEYGLALTTDDVQAARKACDL